MTETELFGEMAAREVTMLGAGVSNMPLCGMLARVGACLTVRDRTPEAELGERAAALRAMGARLLTGPDYLAGLSGDWIFRSPGIRPDTPEILAAVAAGSRLTSEMEFFLAVCPCPVFAVTGSDGKSTTTTLISLLLRAAREAAGLPGQVFLGGNIGEPLLNRIPGMTKDDAVAAELSSFQLMTVHSPVFAAVITNISENHLNWHRDMAEYQTAKARILPGCTRAVLNWGNERTRALGESCESPVTWFSREPIPEAALRPGEQAICLRDGMIDFWDGRRHAALLPLADIRLPGLHNAENYMAAIAATWGLVPPAVIRDVARTFGGVAHRLEWVRQKDGADYYNSSIDSSPTRTLAALSALAGREIVLLLGGYDKHLSFAPLAEGLAARGHVRKIVLTGATAELIGWALAESDAFRQAGIPVCHVPDFDGAVRAAAAAAKPGDCVLLSPACASFDAFPNFEKRGEHFRALVQSL